MSMVMSQIQARLPGNAQATSIHAQAGKAQPVSGGLSSRRSIAPVAVPTARISKKDLARQVKVFAAAETEEEESFDARNFRRSLSKSDKYIRRVTGDAEALKQMEEDGIGMGSADGLIKQIREENFTYTQDGVTVKLAHALGYCWGVERAVEMAVEARRQYPENQLWLTNEIIHNPTVNKRFADMDVQFIEQDGPTGDKDFSPVSEGDVVILPAFGASVHEMKLLNDKGVQIVDTTCPWVSKVWNAVDQHKKKDYTSIIHGKWAHEETIATASFAGTYLIVKDMKEAHYVVDYILKGGDKAEFMEKFKDAMSPGFDPDADLVSVGMANQTTMLKGETEAMGKLLEKCMMEKYGVADLAEHFQVMDTICDATQERQDAMYNMANEELDMVLVVGGFNSSNTSHLQEIAEDWGKPSFWVSSVDNIRADGSIEHRMADHEMKVTENWLPEGDFTIGVTSGASTPDKALEDCLNEIFRQKRLQAEKLAAV